MTPQATFVALGLAAFAAVGFAALGRGGQAAVPGVAKKSPVRKDKVVLTDAQWKEKLSPKAYHILREEGTEAPFSSSLVNVHAPGVFLCAGCKLPLFRSGDKFDSGTGWPSYVKPFGKDAVWIKRDASLGVVRDEVLCARCDGHLGHVFDDGPKDRGGLRYCIDGDALEFKATKK